MQLTTLCYQDYNYITLLFNIIVKVKREKINISF